MAAQNSQVEKIMNQLEKRFLYEKDEDCMHLLLNFYDLDNIKKINPKYISLRSLRKDIVRFLRYREGSDLIAQGLSYQIHEDINRLELYLYLEGYKYGFNYVQVANRLESLALRDYNPFELSQLEHLYHFNLDDEEVMKLRKKISNHIRKSGKRNHQLTISVMRFNSIVLKPKVFGINRYVDKQMTINYESKKDLVVEETANLNHEEIKGIYRKLTKFLIRNAYSVFEYACWNGVNDRVLRRY